MRCRASFNNGFTLLEIIVVLIIFSLTVALAAPSVVSGLGKAGLKSTTRKMASTLEYTKNMALRERSVYYAEALGDRLIVMELGAEAASREIKAASETEVTSKGGTVIAFYPGGGSSGGLFEVRYLKDDSYYTIKVDAPTGKVIVSTLK